jgi:hypothetical protein
MSNFWKWFDEVKAKASATEYGAAMVAAGFELGHTGGGCTAWEKQIGGGWFILVTNDDASHELENGDIVIGVHGPNCEYTSTHSYAATVADAIALTNVHALAWRFAAFVRHDIGEERFPEMRRENVQHVGTGICATHDYCDANMPMLAAWRVTFNRDNDAWSEDDAAQWSRAWDIAKREYLSADGHDVPAIAYDESLLESDWTPSDESAWPTETVTESPVVIPVSPSVPIEEVGTVDLTPTWESILPVLMVALVDGTEEGKRMARNELQRMARIADMASKDSTHGN